jgi:GNAT superfamily N-acetyltransferase
MQLSDGYTDLPPGKIANVVTCLEMHSRPKQRAEPPGVTIALERICDAAAYRAIFARVGAPYLWFARLIVPDEQLERTLRDENVEAYAVRHDGSDEGILELDFSVPRECELLYFGLTEKLVGKGVGRALMNRAIDIAWSRPIERFWLHTCTLDHPGAVSFYVRSGFTPYKRRIEYCDDPRLTGLLPRDCAPNIPLL